MGRWQSTLRPFTSSGLSRSLGRFKEFGLGKGAFGRNVLTLMTGTALAQGVGIAIAPILTRLYQPSDFGVFVLYTSIVGLIGIIATGRYEMAIVLPEKEEDAVDLVALSLLVTTCISLLLLAIVLALGPRLAEYLGNREIRPWLVWTPVGVFLTGLYQTFTFWCTRKEKFKRLAVSRVAQSGATAGANVLMGFLGLGGSGLIGGALAGQALSSVVLVGQAVQGDGDMARSVTMGGIKANAIRYRDFPMVNSLHAFIDVVQSSGLVFLISAYFGSTILGFYSFVLRILKLPLSLIGGAVSQVFFQKASVVHNAGGDLHSLVKKTLFRLGLLALPMLIVILLGGPTLFSIVFGKNWRVAGEYAQILSPWVMGNFIFSPISGVYLIVGRQRTAILFGFIDTILKIASIIVGFSFHNPKLGFYAMSVTGILVLTAEVIWTLAILRET